MKRRNNLQILITVDGPPILGETAIPHAYQTQINHLRHAGCSVQVFVIDDRTSISGIARNLGILRKHIVTTQPDIIVAYYGSMVAAITRLASGKLPRVQTFRGSDLQYTSNPGLVWRGRDTLSHFLSRWAAGTSKQIIVNGPGLFKALPGRLKAKAHNLPNGIDTTVFAPLDASRDILGWSKDEKIVLFNKGVGSGQIVKNLALARQVFENLSHNIGHLRLELISESSKEEVCLRMNASDCLLVTSLSEGSPDLVKEAMACNLPIVSVPCGDVPERLQGVNPSFICPYDVVQLAQAVEKVIQIGQRSNGRLQLFKQGLDIGSVTQQVLAVYQQAVREGQLGL